MNAILSTSAKDTKAFGGAVARALVGRSGPVIVFLAGDLGAGKTTFVQGAGAELGVVGDMASPTFVIQKEYAIRAGAFSRLVHIDAYRIEDARERKTFDWDNTVKDKQAIVFVEWPGNMGAADPRAIVIEFEHVSTDERRIKIPDDISI